ncbi:MAG: hypothetical protein RKO68_14460, partial [Candidatus Accumulibacter sp.]|nr:hypothetical protein [Accumulibacter sp.]
MLNGFRFNPRPSLSKGDAISDMNPAHIIRVSIHAPRCRRAMLHSRNLLEKKSIFEPLREIDSF